VSITSGNTSQISLTYAYASNAAANTSNSWCSLASLQGTITSTANATTSANTNQYAVLTDTSNAPLTLTIYYSNSGSYNALVIVQQNGTNLSSVCNSTYFNKAERLYLAVLGMLVSLVVMMF